MMKLLKKVKVHPFTYVILLLALLSGLIKYVLFIAIILIVHECGHLFFISVFKRKISLCMILPFGGLIKLDSYISENIYEDLLISIGGVFLEIILALIIYILLKTNLINTNTYNIINGYNLIIMGFNLLPICPLDGYKILKLFCELFIPYKRAFKVCYIVSSAILFLGIIFKTSLIKENLLVFTFLIGMLISEIKNEKYLINRFYLERMNHKFKFDRFAYINKKEDMYKNRVNIINGQNEWEYLKHHYL